MSAASAPVEAEPETSPESNDVAAGTAAAGEPRVPEQVGAAVSGAEPDPARTAEGAEPDPMRTAEGAEADPTRAAPGGAEALIDPATGVYTGPERRKHHLRRRVIATLLMVGFALLAFVTGVILFNSVLMPRLIHGAGQVAVPDLTGRTLVQAEQQLQPLGLQLSRAGERFDPSVPRGAILSQDPVGGERVRGSKRVAVVVSLGEEFSSVPALFGESQRSAEALLKSAGLKVGFITRAPGEAAGEGLVAGSDPGPETVLARDTPVNLLVSMGAGEESFVMPELSGREISGVRRQLEALGYRVVTPAGMAQMGTIVSQDPPAGSRITHVTTIVLQATGRVIP